MAFLANTNIFSQLRSHHPKMEGSFPPIRGYHIELGEREKALLTKDPALKRFKSHKNGVRTIKRIGDVLTIVVVANLLSSFFGFELQEEPDYFTPCYILHRAGSRCMHPFPELVEPRGYFRKTRALHDQLNAFERSSYPTEDEEPELPKLIAAH